VKPLRLVATDLDGTLLRSDGTVSARTAQALRRAVAAGIELVMVTGRPPRHVRAIAGAPDLGAVTICMNGALVYDVARDAVLSETRLPPETARALIADLRARLPEVSFAVEVGLHCGWEQSYALQRGKLEEPSLPIAGGHALCAGGVNKLIAFHPALSSAALIHRSRAVIADRAAVSFSGAPFLEIGPYAVSKASSLAAYCAERGVARAEVLAFGDMPNDVPMLAWAGRSVAVANAHRDVQSIAGELTLSNDDDGVAVVLERLLDQH